MSYSLTNNTSTVLSVHPFGPGFLKPGESFSIELEDFNTHLAKLIGAGLLTVSPPLPSNFFPVADNQMLNAVNDLIIKFQGKLASHTDIVATPVDATTQNLEIFVGFEVNTFDNTGVSTTKFIDVPSTNAVTATLAVTANPGSKVITFTPTSPNFAFTVQTANRSDKFGTSTSIFSYSADQGLLAGVLPPETFKFSAASVITIDSAPFTGIKIKATVPGFGFKEYTFA